MSEKTKGEAVPASESKTTWLGGLLTERISRRSFGKLLGAQTVLASTVSLSGCLGGSGGGSDDEAPADPGTQVLSRAAFVATVSDYFDWVHSSEYVDAYKSVQPTFVDVALGTSYAKQIETALEASIISNAQGYFYPDQPITREDAADIYVKAFRIPTSSRNALSNFTDADAISPAKKASVNAIVAAGYMGGTSSTSFSPKATLSANDAKKILTAITSARVAPPQVMCKSGTTAPRRYITISTPTAGATIYYAYTLDGTEPIDPVPANAVSPDIRTYAKTTTYSFDLRTNGVLQFVNPTSSGVDSRLYRLKAVAVKKGMTNSAVMEYAWNIVRPQSGAFQAKLVHAPTSTTPAVYKINNPSEYYQAHVFYIEGSTRGILFDAGEYGWQKANLKTFIDSLAKVPYDLVLGHHHPDHSEQIANFTDAGITFYLNAIEQANLINSGRAADQKPAAALAIVIEDGHVFDLGNVKVTYWQQPGHTDGLATLIINETGWVYASDMWACNRSYTADTTQYNGVKVDRMLSMVQQLLVNYQKCSASGEVTEVTNAHQEVPVGMEGVRNFIQCFQQLIDGGDAATEPSVRGGIVGNPTSGGGSRMSKVGDMWRNKNWMAVGNSLGSSWGGAITEFSAPTTDYPSGVAVDYNAVDGHKKYSVLSKVEITGGTLVGVDVYWGSNYNTAFNSVTYNVPKKLANKFDPWTYAYTINVASGTGSIVFKPTAMSNKITSMKVNGTAIKQGESVTVPVSAGSKITVDIVAPDGMMTSSYTFTVVLI